MNTAALMTFAKAISSGAVRVVDLTQTLTPEFPTIALPPELGQCAPFRLEEISRYNERGPAWYWNNFSMGEHTGTHFDAPIHWVSGKDLPNNSVDTIVAKNFIAPACVRIRTSRGRRAGPAGDGRRRAGIWPGRRRRVVPCAAIRPVLPSSGPTCSPAALSSLPYPQTRCSVPSPGLLARPGLRC